jgi:hypothetical protein
VTLDAVTEACPLPVMTSAQKSELITLTRVLHFTTGVQLNLYMDSKYAFTTIHIHGAHYKERGLINSGGIHVRYGQEILEMLEAVWAIK